MEVQAWMVGCRAQTYGMMVVSKADSEVECEFRHLSLAEYLSALYIHTTVQVPGSSPW